MEGCLLCLELSKECLDCIKADSIQWQEHDIKTLLEKHFWIMESFSTSSWLCKNCWQTLYDFHKFYTRIEQVHMNSKILITNERDENKSKDLFDNVKFNECYLDTEIFIKEEEQQQNLDVEVNLFENKYITNATEKTNKDPLQQPKSCSTRKRTKNATSSQLSQNSENIQLQIKKDPDSLQNADKSTQSYDSADSEDFDSLNEKLNQNPLKQSKSCSTRKCTKPANSSQLTQNSEKEKIQIKQNPKSLQKTDKSKESNDSGNSEEFDSSNEFYDKSNENNTKRHKQNAKERDKFLLENFKMSCHLCKIEKENFKALVKHVVMEHKQIGYAFCCNLKFYKRSTLVAHVQRHINPNQFKCDQCGKCLSNHKSLQAHKIIHLSEEEKKFKCTECDNTYGSLYKLRYHMKGVHLKKYVKICHICGKSFKSCTGDYKAHMAKHEGKLKPKLTCDICGLTIVDKRGLKRHVATQHPVGGKTQHFCPHCPKSSVTLKALKMHIKILHKTGLDYKCTICEKAFRRPEALKEHIASHTGTASYKCPWCPKEFTRSSNMHTHRRKLHPKEFEEAKLLKYSGNLPVHDKNHVETKDDNKADAL